MVLSTTSDTFDPSSVTRSAGLQIFCILVLGFRFAPPQALRCRPLPRAELMGMLSRAADGELSCLSLTFHDHESDIVGGFRSL